MAGETRQQETAGRRIAIDEDAIRELTALLDELGLSEIEIEQNGERLRVARHIAASAGAVARPAAEAPAAVAGRSRSSAVTACAMSTRVAVSMVGSMWPPPSRPGL